MSSLNKAKQRRLGEQELREFVRYARKHEYYRESFHSDFERAHRNISPDDIAYGLDREDWVLRKEPDYDMKHQSWEYEIRTVDIDGVELGLKITLDLETKRFEVISKW